MDRTCYVCNETKIESEFKNKYTCVACFKMKRKTTLDKYRKTHAEQISIYTIQYHQTHKEQIQNYYKANKEYILDRGKIYRQTHEEQIKQQKKNYSDTHQEQIKKYNEINKEYILKRGKQRREKNFIQYLLWSCKNKKLGFDLDEPWLMSIMKSQNNKCKYCNFEIFRKTDEKWIKFLQISIDRQNSDIGYTKENCVLVCLFCNLSKNASLIEHFMDYINALKNNDSTEIINKYKNVKKDTQWASDLNATMKTFTTKEKISNQFSPTIIKQMFKDQNGKDYFTGLPLISSKIPRFPFKPSIDRLDNSKPHTPDNCVLVCLAGNYGRHVATVEEYKQHILMIRQR